MSKKRIIQIVVLPFILTIWLWIGTLWLTSWAMAININLCPEGMVLINGGTYKMGADDSDFQEVTVGSFCIDKYEVTNAEFAKFVELTGYITVAQRPLSKEQFPHLSDEERLPGSQFFKHQNRVRNRFHF